MSTKDRGCARRRGHPALCGWLCGDITTSLCRTHCWLVRKWSAPVGNADMPRPCPCRRSRPRRSPRGRRRRTAKRRRWRRCASRRSRTWFRFRTALGAGLSIPSAPPPRPLRPARSSELAHSRANPTTARGRLRRPFRDPRGRRPCPGVPRAPLPCDPRPPPRPRRQTSREARPPLPDSRRRPEGAPATPRTARCPRPGKPSRTRSRLRRTQRRQRQRSRMPPPLLSLCRPRPCERTSLAHVRPASRASPNTSHTSRVLPSSHAAQC